MEFQEYFKFDLVKADMLTDMHKAIQVVGFCRLESHLPGVMDCQIETVVYETFRKLGKPVPKVSPAKGLKALVYAFRKEKVKKGITRCKMARTSVFSKK